MKQRKSKTIVSTGDLLSELMGKVVTAADGTRMSAREATIRGLYAKSLAGDIDASIDLQCLRDQAGVEEVPRVCGVLLIPEKIPEAEWEKRCAEQQAPYREKNNGKN